MFSQYCLCSPVSLEIRPFPPCSTEIKCSQNPWEGIKAVTCRPTGTVFAFHGQKSRWLITHRCKPQRSKTNNRGRTGLVVRASDSGSGDPGSILGRVGVLFP